MLGELTDIGREVSVFRVVCFFPNETFQSTHYFGRSLRHLYVDRYEITSLGPSLSDSG